MRIRFPLHGVANHVLLKQSGSGLAKPKSALSVGAFYSHTLAWLPKVTERTSLGMKLNPQVCFEGTQIGGLLFNKRSEPKKGVWCDLGD